jgi:hypothetical protein
MLIYFVLCGIILCKSEDLKMDIPMTEKRDIKIFILYLMDRIGYKLKLSDVCGIMYQENVVSYFDCAECFTELIDANHIVKVGEDEESGEAYYVVSETGKKIATELNDAISSTIKEASYRSAIRHLSFQRRGAEIDCYSRERENGKYMVHCEIKEHGKLVLDINVETDSQKEAEKMLRNFRQRPEIVFQGTLALVSGDKNYIFE